MIPSTSHPPASTIRHRRLSASILAGIFLSVLLFSAPLHLTTVPNGPSTAEATL